MHISHLKLRILIEERVGTPKLNRDCFEPLMTLLNCQISVPPSPRLSRLDIPSQESSGEKGHPCFVPDHSRKVSSFSPLSMLAVGFLKDIFYQVEELPLYS